MATKTISIDLEAYERLHKARLRPDESFSKVIRRAQWHSRRSTGRALLEALEGAAPLSKRVLERLEKAQRDDAAPPDEWNG
jgi:predicted CopG family antitoxin